MSLNKKAVEPDLRALLALLKFDIFSSMNCHHIGTIESFDSVKWTVKASINYKRVLNDQPQDYHVLVDMPLFILSGGNARLEMPVKEGDECLIAFNDRDIDNWFSGGPPVVPNSPRFHSFSDGIALVGVNAVDTVQIKSALASYDTTRASLRNGLSRVGVSATHIRIENAVTTLGTQIDFLMAALTVFATATSAAAIEPTLGPAAAALNTALAPVRAALQGLIE